MAWYYHRLRAMTAPEALYRVEQRVLGALDRVRVPQPATTHAPALVAGLTGRFLPPVNGSRVAGRLHQQDPGLQEALRREAIALRAHRVELFGQRYQLGPVVDWRYDVVLDKHWPLVHHTRVDHRGGGAKFIWELNRHQHLVTLARAYRLGQDEADAVEVCDQLASWLAQNPPYQGINWTSGLEVAIRAISWLWILYFLDAPPCLTAALRAEIASSLVAHGHYLARHLSGYSSANNHLIGEATGLAVLGLVLADLPEAGPWRRRGLRVLAKESAKQIYADGVGAEQALHYLAFDLDFYLLAVQVARRNGLVCPPYVQERLRAAAAFLRNVCDSSGHAPAFGDADEGRAFRVDASANAYTSTLARCAAVLGYPEVWPPATPFDESALWLGGPGRSQAPATTPETAGLATRLYALGGYAVMRVAPTTGHEERLLVMDCGPLGYLSLAAHGHADCLALCLHAAGHPLLVDPGAYIYHEQPQWRRYFRSTAAHSTVVVDGRSQSAMLGPMLWGRRATARRHDWHAGPGFTLLCASHNGYAHGATPVTHRRTVLFIQPSRWIVVDELTGRGEHLLEGVWQLAPDLTVTLDAKTGTARGVGGVEDLVLTPLRDCLDHAEVARGAVDPPRGWFSPRFAQKVPSPAVTYQWRGRMPHRFMTVIDLLPKSTPNPTLRLVQGQSGHGALVTRISEPAGHSSYLLQASEDRAATPIQVGNLSYTGRALYLVTDHEGIVQRAHLWRGRRLSLDGEPIWAAARDGPAENASARWPQTRALRLRMPTPIAAM